MRFKKGDTLIHKDCIHPRTIRILDCDYLTYTYRIQLYDTDVTMVVSVDFVDDNYYDLAFAKAKFERDYYNSLLPSEEDETQFDSKIYWCICKEDKK